MKRTPRLLLAGVPIFPIFIGVSLLLTVVSPPFSLARHEISLLLVGQFGWLQMANFILTGVLGLAFAIGLWRNLHGQKAGTWGPILLGVFGIAFLLAGVFHPDPQLGYPVGAPMGVPAPQTSASTIHSLAFSILALAIIAAGFVFARRFIAEGKRSLGIYSLINSLAIITFVMLGGVSMESGNGGIYLFGAAVTISSWVSVIAYQLYRNQNKGDQL